MALPRSTPGELNDAISKALTIGRSSAARERTIDITTIGRRSGKLRRIEIWFHRVSGELYLSSLPARPSWYANLIANPCFILHLKNGIVADLSAIAIPVTDAEERRMIFREIVDDLNQPSNPGRIRQPTRDEDWVAGSPLIRISVIGYATNADPRFQRKT
jgi:hypothetical protein